MKCVMANIDISVDELKTHRGRKGKEYNLVKERTKHLYTFQV